MPHALRPARRTVGVALWFCLAACNEPPMQEATFPAVASEAQIAATIGDAPLQTLWTPSAQSMIVPEHSHRPRLAFTRMAAKKDALVLEPKHSAEGSTHSTTDTPQVTVHVNDCPYDVPYTPTALRYAGLPGKIALRRASMPRGDIDVIVRVHDSLATMSFRNDGSEIEPITLEDRKGYRVVPADPSQGLAEVGDYQERPACPTQGTRVAFTREER